MTLVGKIVTIEDHEGKSDNRPHRVLAVEMYSDEFAALIEDVTTGEVQVRTFGPPIDARELDDDDDDKSERWRMRIVPEVGPRENHAKNLHEQREFSEEPRLLNTDGIRKLIENSPLLPMVSIQRGNATEVYGLQDIPKLVAKLDTYKRESDAERAECWRVIRAHGMEPDTGEDIASNVEFALNRLRLLGDEARTHRDQLLLDKDQLFGIVEQWAKRHEFTENMVILRGTDGNPLPMNVVLANVLAFALRLRDERNQHASSAGSLKESRDRIAALEKILDQARGVGASGISAELRKLSPAAQPVPELIADAYRKANNLPADASVTAPTVKAHIENRADEVRSLRAARETLTRDEAVKIAVDCARARQHDHSYLRHAFYEGPHGGGEFEPHAWVVDAVIAAWSQRPALAGSYRAIENTELMTLLDELNVAPAATVEERIRILARSRNGWEKDAVRERDNRDYWRSIVKRIADLLPGDETHASDGGEVEDSVLANRVVPLVKHQIERRATLDKMVAGDLRGAYKLIAEMVHAVCPQLTVSAEDVAKDPARWVSEMASARRVHEIAQADNKRIVGEFNALQLKHSKATAVPAVLPEFYPGTAVVGDVLATVNGKGEALIVHNDCGRAGCVFPMAVKRLIAERNAARSRLAELDADALEHRLRAVEAERDRLQERIDTFVESIGGHRHEVRQISGEAPPATRPLGIIGPHMRKP